MCFQIPTLISCNTRRHRHQGRNRNPSNLLYPPSSLSSQVLVHGGLWNCLSAVLKADFITAFASAQSLDFLALTETWITPENSATPAALSSAFAFSHSPRPTGRGGGTGLLLSRKWSFTVLSFLHLDISSFEFHAVTISFPVKLHIIVLYRPPGPLGNFIDELDTLLSGLPVESSLILLGDFNLPSEKLQSSCLLPLLSSFSLSLNLSAPTHRAGNTLDLVFSRPAPALDLTVTPLDFSDHHFLSFTLSLPALPTNTTSSTSTTHRNLRAISPSSLASTILTTLPNPDSFSSLPLETATNTFLSSITSSINTLSPLTSRPAKSSPATPWLSDVLRNNRRELRIAERKWKKSQQYSDLCSYQSLLSRFSTEVSSRISACLNDVSMWMSSHHLKLNPSKTDLLFIPGTTSPHNNLSISFENSLVTPSAEARSLGVVMDDQLSFSSHIANLTRSCRFLLYNIRRIRPFLSQDATQVLVQSLVISRLDYCNSLLAGLPLRATKPLQLIQNAAARLVFNLPKFSHVTPLLRFLHWLPVAARIRFKTLTLAYKAKNGPAPSYLMAMVKARSAPRALRASSTARLEPPSLKTHRKQTSRLFSVLAPRWWNELPLDVRTAESLTVFKRRLKTHLFKEFLN
ncbi:uncharacterized protein LOC111194633 [Astyanax mexicanus]|uniref:uncharacterized protein LOC111194633 n=1 Tax=Astyanax mexicanus TaxID=7994 RepID=UPI0020CAA39E|nr:uncharacterized protein LOC111194633 [Astyanax mexicanus]